MYWLYTLAKNSNLCCEIRASLLFFLVYLPFGWRTFLVASSPNKPSPIRTMKLMQFKFAEGWQSYGAILPSIFPLTNSLQMARNNRTFPISSEFFLDDWIGCWPLVKIFLVSYMFQFLNLIFRSCRCCVMSLLIGWRCSENHDPPKIINIL